MTKLTFHAKFFDFEKWGNPRVWGGVRVTWKSKLWEMVQKVTRSVLSKTPKTPCCWSFHGRGHRRCPNLGHFEKFWDIFGHFGTLLEILGHPAGHSGISGPLPPVTFRDNFEFPGHFRVSVWDNFGVLGHLPGLVPGQFRYLGTLAWSGFRDNCDTLGHTWDLMLGTP